MCVCGCPFDEPGAALYVHVRAHIYMNVRRGIPWADFIIYVLCRSVRCGALECVLLLLDQGADPNFTTTTHSTALHLACERYPSSLSLSLYLYFRLLLLSLSLGSFYTHHSTLATAHPHLLKLSSTLCTEPTAPSSTPCVVTVPRSPASTRTTCCPHK